MPAPSVETTLRLRRLLVGLERQVSEMMRLDLEPAGLTVEDWAVLCLLSDGAGHTMAEVIDAAGVPAPSATRLVDKLVSTALVHRAVDPQDRRRVLALLSPSGRELHGRLAPAQKRIAQQFTAGFGAEELTALMSALDAALSVEAHDTEARAGLGRE